MVLLGKGDRPKVSQLKSLEAKVFITFRKLSLDMVHLALKSHIHNGATVLLLFFILKTDECI